MNQKPLKAIPSVVQLPGGVRLSAVPFRVLERNEDGSPRVFEILPKERSAEADWQLFADETRIRAPRA